MSVEGEGGGGGSLQFNQLPTAEFFHCVTSHVHSVPVKEQAAADIQRRQAVNLHTELDKLPRVQFLTYFIS
jgi:hypothetical protein